MVDCECVYARSTTSRIELAKNRDTRSACWRLQQHCLLKKIKKRQTAYLVLHGEDGKLGELPDGQVGVQPPKRAQQELAEREVVALPLLVKETSRRRLKAVVVAERQPT